jgi:hypothetical protein
MDTFSREDLANGKTTAETQTDDEAVEVADETADEVEAGDEPAATRSTSGRIELEDTDVKFSQPPAYAPASDAPMPDLADDDIAFDNDKYRTKMKTWVDQQASSAAERAVQEVQRARSVAEMRSHVEAEVKKFTKDHPDFETVVGKNPVLAQNQLHPEAGAAVAADRNVAAILYHFGKNPQYAIQVARMPLAQQLVAVGHLKQKIAMQQRTTRTERDAPQRQTITRKAPVTRDQQMSTSVAEMAQQSRGRKAKSRFYGR